MSGSNGQRTDIITTQVANPNPSIIGRVTVSPASDWLSEHQTLHPSLPGLPAPLFKFGAIYAVQANRQVVDLNGIYITNVGDAAFNPFASVGKIGCQY